MELALAVAAAQDAQMVPVEVMGAPSRVVVSGEMGKAVFLAEDLPTPAKGQCYQVWRVAADGTKTSAGVFTPDPDGHVVAVLEAEPGTSAFVITLEPPGGSKAPSGPMVGQADA
jgi:anti-sigma-K factor RskA